MNSIIYIWKSSKYSARTSEPFPGNFPRHGVRPGMPHQRFGSSQCRQNGDLSERSESSVIKNSMPEPSHQVVLCQELRDVQTVWLEAGA